ncbi:MAG: 50S ribosomal protein L23 [Patescibacteria group bacterium]|nr:50S ribosomal protein L23 [Patescibacteria group bacterium]
MAGLLEKIGVKGKKKPVVSSAKEETKSKGKVGKKRSQKETSDKLPEHKAKVENAYRVLLGFVNTEKSSQDAQLGKYCFKVNPKFGKRMIQKAVEEYYGVVVTRVNVMNYKPKSKRFRLIKGTRGTYKKAVVTLKDGDSIK